MITPMINIGLEVARKMIADLFTPSDFRYDWYGWVTNQMAHIMAGVIITSLVSYLNFVILGEFALKLHLFMIVAVFFILTQSKSFLTKPFDTFEDLVFILVYGAGTVILLFHETDPGSPIITANIQHIAPVLVLASAHLLWGSVTRAIRELKK